MRMPWRVPSSRYYVDCCDGNPGRGSLRAVSRALAPGLATARPLAKPASAYAIMGPWEGSQTLPRCWAKPCVVGLEVLAEWWRRDDDLTLAVGTAPPGPADAVKSGAHECRSARSAHHELVHAWGGPNLNVRQRCRARVAFGPRIAGDFERPMPGMVSAVRTGHATRQDSRNFGVLAPCYPT